MSAAASGAGNLLEQRVDFLMLRIVLLEALLATEDVSFIFRIMVTKKEGFMNSLRGWTDLNHDVTAQPLGRTEGHAVCILDRRVA